MNKAIIGTIFIIAGFAYELFVIDWLYNHTLGWLVANGWIKPPEENKKDITNFLGRKTTITLYSIILIIIGLFILWNRNN
jgi:hypothetical protein